MPLVGGADTTDPLHKDIPDMNQNVGINMNVNPVSVQPIGMSAFDELDPPANTSISDAVGESAHSSMPGLGLGSQMGLFVGTRPSEGPSETMKVGNNDVVDDFGDDEEFGDFSSNETKSALSMATGLPLKCLCRSLVPWVVRRYLVYRSLKTPHFRKYRCNYSPVLQPASTRAQM